MRSHISQDRYPPISELVGTTALLGCVRQDEKGRGQGVIWVVFEFATANNQMVGIRGGRQSYHKNDSHRKHTLSLLQRIRRSCQFCQDTKQQHPGKDSGRSS